MNIKMKRFAKLSVAMGALALLSVTTAAYAQKDAGAKMRGDTRSSFWGHTYQNRTYSYGYVPAAPGNTPPAPGETRQGYSYEPAPAPAPAPDENISPPASEYMPPAPDAQMNQQTTPTTGTYSYGTSTGRCHQNPSANWQLPKSNPHKF